MNTLEIISEIVSEKKAKGIWPTHATEREVIQRCQESSNELKELEKKGQIKLGPTINGIYITVIQ